MTYVLEERFETSKLASAGGGRPYFCVKKLDRTIVTS